MKITSIFIFAVSIYLISDGLYKLNNKKNANKSNFLASSIFLIKDNEGFYKLEGIKNIFIGFFVSQLYISALLKNDSLFYLTLIILLSGSIFLRYKYIKLIELKKTKTS